jgi:hypothetical protein
MVLGVGRGRPAWPHWTRAATLALPMAVALGGLGMGKVHPSPLYKGGPGEMGHTTELTMCLMSSLPGASPLSTSLSLSRGLLKGCVGARRHHRSTPSCCGVFGSCLKPSTSAISAGSGILEVIVITVRMWVCGGAACCGVGVVAPSSSTIFEVGYVGFIDIACGSGNPMFVHQGYVTEHQFTVTELLVDRSLRNSGFLRKYFFKLFASNPNDFDIVSSLQFYHGGNLHNLSLFSISLGFIRHVEKSPRQYINSFRSIRRSSWAIPWRWSSLS